MPVKKKTFEVNFWGVRGSIPAPGKEFQRYGGNTPCVEVRADNNIFIFDAGTGIRGLGQKLAGEFSKKQKDINIFISHTHWDHIQGFPFFAPIYMQNFSVNVYGGHSDSDIRSLMYGQMKREYFPVTLDELPAKMDYIDLDDNPPIHIKDVEIYYTYLLHPALSMGFRLSYNKKVFVYATDNELFTNKSMPEFNFKNIGELIRDADVLVAEAQYTEEEYSTKIGWGHSTINGVIKLCRDYNVKNLYIYHHDPYHDDKFVDSIVKDGKLLAGPSLKVFGAKEGMSVII